MSNNDKTKEITKEELNSSTGETVNFDEINDNKTVIMSEIELIKVDSESEESKKQENIKPENKQKKKIKEKDRPSKLGYSWKFIKIFVVFLVIISAVVGSFVLYTFYDIYSDESISISDSSFYKSKRSQEIYDINGNFITALTPNYVDWVTLDTIPEYYIDGLIATEDTNFYEHNGVDYIALVKGVGYELTGRNRGGSTLTMQLGKVLYMEDWYIPDENGVIKSSENMIDYKFTQMSYALKIEQQYSKDEILENYLNSINYGGAYGIENASKYYFGHPASELTLSESALLIGLPQSPSYYDPFVYPENALEIRNEVLAAMLDKGVITKEQYDEEFQVEIASLLTDEDFVPSNVAAEFIPYLDIVTRELDERLDELAGENEDLEQTGIKVYTYLDPELQKTNYIDGSTDQSDITFQDEHIQNGMVQLDTQNGAVYSVVNGRGERGRGGTNFAYNYPRQPGSTSKPIVDYGPAIEFLNWSSYHAVEDSPINYRNGGPAVTNAGVNYYGLKPIQYSLAISSNTPALRTFYEVVDSIGYDKLGEFMLGLGITDIPAVGLPENPETEKPYVTLREMPEIDYNANYELYPYDAYSIGGWVNGTTPMEMAGAYATFGNGGIYNEPHTINYLEIDESSPYFEILGEKYEYEYRSHRAMKEETAYILTMMLDADYVDAANVAGFAANGPYSSVISDHYQQSVPEIRAKTGTTNWDNSNPSIAEGTDRDQWVVGYTGNVTTAIWTGYEAEYEQQGYYPGGRYVSNGYDAYELFHVFSWNAQDSSGAHLHDSSLPPKPDNVVVEYYVRNSTNKASGSQPYYFISGSEDQTTTYEPDTPSVNGATSSNGTVSYSWDAVEGASSYKVYIDNTLYRTVTSTSISIPSSAFADTTSCKSSYTLSVSASDGSSESDRSGTTNVDFGSTDFCAEPEPEPEPEPEENTESTE